MRKFIQRMCLTLIPVFLIGLFVEWQLTNEPELFYKKSEYLKFYSDEVELLLLGNSTIGSAIIPDSVHPNAYNLALPAEHPLRSLDLALKLTEVLPNLKTVVLGLNYHSLFFTDQTMSINEINYWKFFGIPPESKIDNLFKSFAMRPGYVTRMVFSKDQLFNETDDGLSQFVLNEKGHYYGSQDVPDKPESAKDKFETLNTIAGTEYLEFNKTIFKERIAVLNSLGVNVILLRLPSSETFSQHQNPDWVQLHNRAIEEMIETCVSCSYYDYTDISQLKSDEYYTDTFHFNLKGAQLLSRIFMMQRNLQAQF